MPFQQSDLADEVGNCGGGSEVTDRAGSGVNARGIVPGSEAEFITDCC